MKASIASLLVLCIAAAAGFSPFVGAARAVEAGLTDPPPGACGAAIGRLETALNTARSSGHVVASAPESVGAMLHRQPTRDSVARAQSDAVKRVEDSIVTARKLRAEGKRAECIGMLEKVAAPLGTR